VDAGLYSNMGCANRLRFLFSRACGARKKKKKKKIFRGHPEPRQGRCAPCTLAFFLRLPCA
jgi:hypothetical protein